MKNYLLDTSICVFLFRGKHDIEQKLNNIGIEHCYISDITVAELRYGAYKSSQPVENNAMIDAFCEKIGIVPFADSIDVYAYEKNELRKRGSLIEDFDLLIGAAAKSTGMTLVTDNIKHFQHISDLEIENWIER